MKFDIISIFPEFFEGPLSCGIIKTALEKYIIQITITNPRNFAKDKLVDDYQFGGGAGMVMKPEPLTNAINHVKKENTCIVHLTPKGKRLTQDVVKKLMENKHIIIVCGRYKGIDHRINRIFNPYEISIGDYVLSGGETGALVLIESITRLIPGTLGNSDSASSDSFQNHLLESSIYTRPNVYRKHKVPQILRSGNHNLVARWRRKKSIQNTLTQRPDLLTHGTFTKNDLEILLEVLDDENS